MEITLDQQHKKEFIKILQELGIDTDFYSELIDLKLERMD